jgi:transcriptional regulator with XRE-family HTH domain
MGRSPSRKIHQDERVVFGANLRAARLERGLSQQEVADRAERSQAKMPAIEAGRTNITIDTMQRLAMAVGLTVLELLTPKEK